MLRLLLVPLATLALTAGSLAQDKLYNHDKIRDFYFTFKQANWAQLLLFTELSRLDIKADLKVDGKTYTDVGIRVKGHTSYVMPGNKKPFNVTMDAFVPGQELLGHSTINLNNGAVDPTMTREVTSFAVFRDFLPAPRTGYARVHLNGVFWGVYILVQQINKDFTTQWFRHKGGTRYKGDSPVAEDVNTSTLNYFGNKSTDYDKRYGLKTPSHPNAWTDLVNVIDKLNNTPDAQFKQEIVKWINVDRAIWYFACNNLVINSDDYVGAGHNYYMYFDPFDGRMNMIAVDCNESYGVHWPPTKPEHYSPSINMDDAMRPLIKRLMAVPEWRETYLAHYRTVLRKWGDWDTQVGPLTKRLQDSIRADIARDPHYFYTQAQFDPSAPRFFSVFHWIPPLKPTIVARKAWLDIEQDLSVATPQIASVDYSPKGSVAAGSKIVVTAKVTGVPSISRVTLRSSVVGAYVDHQMFDDGAHGDGAANDDVWGGSFTAGNAGERTRFYVVAENAAGTLKFSPEGAEHSHYSVDSVFPNPVGPIVINEILADNNTVDQDEKNQFDDWVELYNRGATAYDLSGHWLSDDPTVPRKWQVPAATSIAAGGFLRIWCDNDPLDGKLHATFKLNDAGEAVALYDTDARSNKLIDGISFGKQKSDRSFGRFPDGSNWLHYMWTPTGGRPYLAPESIVRYDGRVNGSARGLNLNGTGTARVGQNFGWSIEGGPASGAAILFISGGVTSLPFGVLGHLDISFAGLISLGIPLDTAGKAAFSLTVPPAAANAVLYQQAFALDFSNGLATWFR